MAPNNFVIVIVAAGEEIRSILSGIARSATGDILKVLPEIVEETFQAAWVARHCECGRGLV